MNLTEHFTFEELTKTDIADLQAKNRRQAENIKGCIIRLAEWAEAIRSALGNVPMIILSGYRCEELNRRIGGSMTSRHIRAEAIDFVPLGTDTEAAFYKLAALASEIEFGQLILEKRGGGYIIHAGMGTKKELLTSPKPGIYRLFQLSSNP